MYTCMYYNVVILYTPDHIHITDITSMWQTLHSLHTIQLSPPAVQMYAITRGTIHLQSNTLLGCALSNPSVSFPLSLYILTISLIDLTSNFQVLEKIPVSVNYIKGGCTICYYEYLSCSFVMVTGQLYMYIYLFIVQYPSELSKQHHVLSRYRNSPLYNMTSFHGEFYEFTTLNALHSSAFFIPPGTHHCWVDWDSMEEVFLTFLHMTGSVPRSKIF